MVVSPLGVRIRPSAPPRSPSPQPPQLPQRKAPKPMPRNDSLEVKKNGLLHTVDTPPVPISSLLPSLYSRLNDGDQLKDKSFDFEALGDELFCGDEAESQESNTTHSSLSYYTAPQGSSQSTTASRVSSETARFADVSDLEPNLDAENNNRIAPRQLALIPSAPPLTPHVTFRPPRPQHRPPMAMPRSDSLTSALILKDMPASATVTNAGVTKLSGDLINGWGRRVITLNDTISCTNGAGKQLNGNWMNGDGNGKMDGRGNPKDLNLGYSEIKKKSRQSPKKAASPHKKFSRPQKTKNPKIPQPLHRKISDEDIPQPPHRRFPKDPANFIVQRSNLTTSPSPKPPTPPPRRLDRVFAFSSANEFLTEDESVVDPAEKGPKINDLDVAVEAMSALELDPGLKPEALACAVVNRSGDVIEPQSPGTISAAESVEPESEEEDRRFVEYRRRNSILPLPELKRRLRHLHIPVGPLGLQNQFLYAGRLARAELAAEQEAIEKEECRRLNYKFSAPLEHFIKAIERGEHPDIGKTDELLIRDEFNTMQPNAEVGSFCYLLIDARELLPVPTFRHFVDAIFYVGKGKRSRPLQHLCDAVKWKNAELLKRPNAEPTAKIARILELWNAGTGVVSLHLFNNIHSDEALIREAVLIEAIGLETLTNQKRGDLRGSTRQWSRLRLAEYGAFLLRNAHQVYLNERCRPIFERDVTSLKLW